MWHPRPLKEGTLVVQTASGIHEFTVELAEAANDQAYGLMNRPSMPANHGMVFIWHEDSMHDMWMKNTLISLDMLFIDGQGKIVYIAHNTKPDSLDIISAGQPVRNVIELLGGVTDAQGIQVGDSVTVKRQAP